MSNEGSSPFGRSRLLTRSPPPTPTRHVQPVEPNPPPPVENELPKEVISTTEIQHWMTSIDKILGEVCSLVAEGKMNAEQKVRVSNLCRNVSSGASQMAVLYQALKQKTIQAHSTIRRLQEQQNIENTLVQIKEVVKGISNPPEPFSYANMVKKGSDNYVRPANLNSVAIYPSDKTKSSDDTKFLVQKIISPGELKLHVRDLKKVKNGGVLMTPKRTLKN